MPDPILLLAALLAVALVVALTVAAAIAIMRRGPSPSERATERQDEIAAIADAIWNAPAGSVVTCSHGIPPRGMDPVTVTDGRVERVTGGVA